MSDIVKQISLILDTDGKSHEVVLDTEKLSLGRGDGTVGHGDGVLGKGFNTTERFGKGEDLEVLEEGAGLLETTLQVDGDHTTGASGLLLLDFVSRVALKTGVDNLLDFLVSLHQFGKGKGVRLSLLDSDGKGLGTSDDDPGIESGETSSHSLEDEEESVVESLIVEHKTSGNNVGVTTNVLGERVGNNIGTEEEGVLVYGGGEGVVNNKDDTGSLKSISDLADVEDLKGGVGGGLQPADLSVGADAGLEFLDVSEVGLSDIDAGVGVENLAKISVSATVNIIDTKDVITALKDVHDGNVGSHTAGASEGVVSVFHGGEGALKAGTGGVTATGIVVNDWDTSRGLSVGGGEGDGRAHGTELLIGLVTSVDESG